MPSSKWYTVYIFFFHFWLAELAIQNCETMKTLCQFHQAELCVSINMKGKSLGTKWKLHLGTLLGLWCYDKCSCLPSTPHVLVKAVYNWAGQGGTYWWCCIWPRRISRGRVVTPSVQHYSWASRCRCRRWRCHSTSPCLGMDMMVSLRLNIVDMPLYLKHYLYRLGDIQFLLQTSFCPKECWWGCWWLQYGGLEQSQATFGLNHICMLYNSDINYCVDLSKIIINF